MKLNKLIAVLFVLIVFGSVEACPAELELDAASHILFVSGASQEPPEVEYKGQEIEVIMRSHSKPLVASNSAVLAKLIARMLVPVEMVLWSTSNSFSMGLSGTIALSVSNDLSFHLASRTSETEQFPDSMRKPLLSAQSNVEYDIQKAILSERLHFKRMEEGFLIR